MSGSQRFPFVQLELAGVVGLDAGRYLGHDPERVLVVRVAGAPTPPRYRLRRAQPRLADPAAEQPTVPLTTLTAIRPPPFTDAAAADSWLGQLRTDPGAIASELEGALVFINRALHAYRAAALDPGLCDAGSERALAVRVGFGSGEGLADGRFSEAIEVPVSERRRRTEALRPQERVAAVLGGREEVALCEMLLLRARADLDAGRLREAALQVRVGLEALLAEPEMLRAPGQDADLAKLRESRRTTGEAAGEALAGELTKHQAAQTARTLRLCERVVRRSRLS